MAANATIAGQAGAPQVGARAATRSIQIVFLALFVAAWHVAAESGAIHRLFLPTLDAVWHELKVIARSGELGKAAAITIVTVAKAYAIAAIAGIGLGFVIARSDWLVRLFEPVLSGMFAIPLTLFFPLFIFYFGIGTGSKVAYGATYGFFPIVLNTIAAFAGVDRHLLRAARSMGASPGQMLRHIYLPAARPVIVTGLRIGFFITVAAVLGGETLSSAAGIGRAIALSAELMETARMYAWIVVVVLASFALNMAAQAAETRAARVGAPA